MLFFERPPNPNLLCKDKYFRTGADQKANSFQKIQNNFFHIDKYDSGRAYSKTVLSRNQLLVCESVFSSGQILFKDVRKKIKSQQNLMLCTDMCLIM